MRLPPSSGVFLASAASFSVLWFLHGTEVLDHFRLQRAEVAALVAPPRLWLSLPVLLLALVAVGVYGWASRRRRPPGFPGYRLLPILLVVTVFADFLVLSESAVPVSSADQTAITLAVLQRGLFAGTRGTVPTDPDKLRTLVQGLGPPPYHVRGQRPSHWNLQVRSGCEGPVGEAPGTEPLTIIYCVSSDRRLAWITVLSLPAEQKFGPAAMFSRGGEIQMVPIFDPQAAEPGAPLPERPPSEPAAPVEGGRFERGPPD
jgi:hypothetical protein